VTVFATTPLLTLHHEYDARGMLSEIVVDEGEHTYAYDALIWHANSRTSLRDVTEITELAEV
jgi:hypothetical protein